MLQRVKELEFAHSLGLYLFRLENGDEIALTVQENDMVWNGEHVEVESISQNTYGTVYDEDPEGLGNLLGWELLKEGNS